MSATSSIEWTEKTWNPVRGCSIVSPGCVHCYAMKQAHRFSGPGKAYEGLTKQAKAGPQWTGVVRTVESALLEPLSWRKPTRIFVNSMSDLFHDDVPDEFIDSVFGVMGRAPQHTFQILTKRPDRMRRYFADEDDRSELIAETLPTFGTDREGVLTLPLPNVWLGVSCENQQTADERIPLLLQTPAAVRWVSAEPLLGPINFGSPELRRNYYGAVNWVVVGGESGPGARPFDVAWVRSIVLQGKSAGVPVFVKQLGAFVVDRNDAGFEGDPDDSWTPETRYDEMTPQGWQGDPVRIRLRDRKGGDMSEWPADLRVRMYPGGDSETLARLRRG